MLYTCIEILCVPYTYKPTCIPDILVFALGLTFGDTQCGWQDNGSPKMSTSQSLVPENILCYMEKGINAAN